MSCFAGIAECLCPTVKPLEGEKPAPKDLSSRMMLNVTNMSNTFSSLMNQSSRITAEDFDYKTEKLETGFKIIVTAPPALTLTNGQGFTSWLSDYMEWYLEAKKKMSENDIKIKTRAQIKEASF